MTIEKNIKEKLKEWQEEVERLNNPPSIVDRIKKAVAAEHNFGYYHWSSPPKPKTKTAAQRKRAFGFGGATKL